MKYCVAVVLKVCVGSMLVGCGPQDREVAPSAQGASAGAATVASAGAMTPANSRDTAASDAAPSAEPRWFKDSAERELDALAALLGCQLRQGNRENITVCLEEGYYVAVAARPDGSLEFVQVSALSRDRWASAIEPLEQVMARYSNYGTEIRNLYQAPDDTPTLQEARRMALQTWLTTDAMFGGPEISIPADSAPPWVTFRFTFE
ncbi:MAG: hypothetical protein ACNA8J_12490 [Gammaproteobacteria bacterium]